MAACSQSPARGVAPPPPRRTLSAWTRSGPAGPGCCPHRLRSPPEKGRECRLYSNQAYNNIVYSYGMKHRALGACTSHIFYRLRFRAVKGRKRDTSTVVLPLRFDAPQRRSALRGGHRAGVPSSLSAPTSSCLSGTRAVQSVDVRACIRACCAIPCHTPAHTRTRARSPRRLTNARPRPKSAHCEIRICNRSQRVVVLHL